MKVRRILAALTCLVLVLSCFAACGEKKPSEKEAAKTAKNETTAAATQAPSGPVEASWFDDAVFVGDSVTLKLSYYCENNPDALSDTQFFCAGSLGYTNALWDINAEGNVHPYYQGTNYLSQDCAKVTGAKKVFIMLGMNDIGLYGIEDSMKSAKTLIGNILKTTPDVKIYVQSVTPIIAGKERGDLNNANIKLFNAELVKYCKEKGYTYLDVNTIMADESGYLKSEYCSDPDAQGIHFTDAACSMWADFLKKNVLK